MESGSRRNEVAIVGAGDVLARYIGADIAAAHSSSLRIAHVLDIRPVAFDVTRSKYLDAGLTPPAFHKLEAGTGYALVNYLDSLDVSGPLVIATPTPTHLDYALSCLGSGRFAGLEKPYVGSLKEAEVLDGFVRSHGVDRIFLFGYYLLEKGLPLIPLMRAGAVPRPYLDEVSPSLSPSEWSQLRHRLGDVVEVAGCIFEGLGPKGGLSARPWVLDPAAGGITFEQFYHLVCLLALIAESQVVAEAEWAEIEDVLLIHDADLAAQEESRGSPPPAETLTFARLRLRNGAPVVLGAGKYVPPELHERWLRVSFERGQVFVDLERREMQVDARSLRHRFGLRRPVPYGTQWYLFEESIVRRSPKAEYGLSYLALRLTARIRDLGLGEGIAAAVIRPEQAPLVRQLMSTAEGSPPLRALISGRS